MTTNKQPIYREDADLYDMLKDGWMRNFTVEQTIEEISLSGITLSEGLVKSVWRLFNQQMEASMEKDYGTS